MILRSGVFLILMVFVLWTFLYNRKTDQRGGLWFSSGDLVRGLKPSLKVVLSRNILYLRWVALVLIVLALCRPQVPLDDSRIETEGIDIVLALDSSTSMLAEDFELNGRRENRVEVIKAVVKNFVEARSNDRLSLVVFAARAYTACPLTLDHDWLLTNLERIKAGMLEDGTAIGSGIAAALNRLRNSQAKSKVIILLTDGRNNAGKISPQTAAEAAAALKVKIYTIGAGAKGPVPYPVQDFFGNKTYQKVSIDLDEEALTKIASVTGGQFFRATDTETLRRIYQEIDQLEKTPMQEKGYQEYKELFAPFLVLGLFLLLFEVVLTNTLLRRIP